VEVFPGGTGEDRLLELQKAKLDQVG
jgi:hypothetical protein